VKKIILPSILIAAFLAFLTPFFIKVRLECRSQFGVCPSEINSKIQTLNSKSLFSVKREITKILGNDPQVSDFSYQFKLVNTLIVNLLVTKPEFAILDKNSGKSYLVDKAGKVISEVADSPLPVLVQVGQDVNIFALNLVRGIYQMYGVSRGEVTDSSLVIELPGPVKVIFPVKGDDYQVLLGSLRLIYAKITAAESPGKYTEIDLRFKNPVLR